MKKKKLYKEKIRQIFAKHVGKLACTNSGFTPFGSHMTKEIEIERANGIIAKAMNVCLKGIMNDLLKELPR
jgi:hypothetical protein